MQIYAISDETLIWQGPATLVGSVVCGAIGLFTLVFVVAKLFLGHNSIARPALICTGVALGTLPIAPIALYGDSLAWKLVGALPLAVSAHILFLSRKMLFLSWRDGLRSTAVAAAVALTPLFVLALDPLATADRTLKEQSILWREAAPQRYEFTVQVNGWQEPEALSPKRITVESGNVISAVYAWNSPRHNAGDPAPVEDLWTIDRAFSELVAAKERGWDVSARFNERWHFVERAFVEPDEPASGWDLEIREFMVDPD
jgi:hypothetical protein